MLVLSFVWVKCAACQEYNDIDCCCGVGLSSRDSDGLALPVARTTADETKQVKLAAVEVCMGEVPKLCVSITPQYTLLQMRYFVETVHLELPDKRGKVLMFIPATEDLASETFVIQHIK